MKRFLEILRRPRTRMTHTSLLILGVLILLLPSVASSLTNTIIMKNKTTADYQALTVNANTLKPKGCDTINLTNVVVGSGTVNGTAGNDLILATSPNATLNGLGGSDCLVISGSAGIGGRLNGGGPAVGDTDTDICIGGMLTIYDSCETVQRTN